VKQLEAWLVLRYHPEIKGAWMRWRDVDVP